MVLFSTFWNGSIAARMTKCLHLFTRWNSIEFLGLIFRRQFDTSLQINAYFSRWITIQFHVHLYHVKAFFIFAFSLVALPQWHNVSRSAHCTCMIQRGVYHIVPCAMFVDNNTTVTYSICIYSSPDRCDEQLLYTRSDVAHFSVRTRFAWWFLCNKSLIFAHQY